MPIFDHRYKEESSMMTPNLNLNSNRMRKDMIPEKEDLKIIGNDHTSLNKTNTNQTIEKMKISIISNEEE